MSTIAADARLASSRASTQTRAVRRRRYLSNAGVLLLSVADHRVVARADL